MSFSAGLHGWAFTLTVFADLYAKKFGVEVRTGPCCCTVTTLWSLIGLRVEVRHGVLHELLCCCTSHALSGHLCCQAQLDLTLACSHTG